MDQWMSTIGLHMSDQTPTDFSTTVLNHAFENRFSKWEALLSYHSRFLFQSVPLRLWFIQSLIVQRNDDITKEVIPSESIVVPNTHPDCSSLKITPLQDILLEYETEWHYRFNQNRKWYCCLSVEDDGTFGIVAGGSIWVNEAKKISEFITLNMHNTLCIPCKNTRQILPNHLKLNHHHYYFKM